MCPLRMRTKKQKIKVGTITQTTSQKGSTIRKNFRSNSAKQIKTLSTISWTKSSWPGAKSVSRNIWLSIKIFPLRCFVRSWEFSMITYLAPKTSSCKSGGIEPSSMVELVQLTGLCRQTSEKSHHQELCVDFLFLRIGLDLLCAMRRVKLWVHPRDRSRSIELKPILIQRISATQPCRAKAIARIYLKTPDLIGVFWRVWVQRQHPRSSLPTQR